MPSGSVRCTYLCVVTCVCHIRPRTNPSMEQHGNSSLPFNFSFIFLVRMTNRATHHLPFNLQTVYFYYHFRWTWTNKSYVPHSPFIYGYVFDLILFLSHFFSRVRSPARRCACSVRCSETVTHTHKIHTGGGGGCGGGSAECAALNISSGQI